MKKIRFALLLMLLALGPMPVRAATPLVVWHSWVGADAALLDTWINAYQAQTGDRVTVEAHYVPYFEMLERVGASDPSPDMIIGPSDWAAALIDKRMVLQLDNRLSPALRGQAVDLAWQLATYDARIIAIPISLEGMLFYYNRSLVEASKLPATLEDLLTQSRQLTAGDITGLIMSKDFYPSAGIFFALGGSLIDEHGDSQLRTGNALAEYLAVLKDLWARSQKAELTLDAPADAFVQGKAAFLIDGNWNLPEYKKALGAALGTAPLPSVRGQAWRPLIRSQQLYLALNSTHVDAALDFGQYVTDLSAQITAAQNAGFVPVNGQAQKADPLIGAIAAQITAGVPLSNRPEMALYWVPLQRAIDAVTLNGTDPDQAAHDAMQQIDKAIDVMRYPATPTPTPMATPAPTLADTGQ
jgi:arabinogalactan oligomer/maltooligosaccharide transport system substrate-binding protein